MTSVSSDHPTHGNYHNYHRYDTKPFLQHNNNHIVFRYRYHHPGGQDTRLALIPRDLLTNVRVLDVGCNEGWVSCEIGASFTSLSLLHISSEAPGLLAQSWGARRVVGVDIDDALVQMAWRRRRTLWSHQAPPPPSSCASRTKRKR